MYYTLTFIRCVNNNNLSAWEARKEQETSLWIGRFEMLSSEELATDASRRKMFYFFLKLEATIIVFIIFRELDALESVQESFKIMSANTS